MRDFLPAVNFFLCMTTVPLNPLLPNDLRSTSPLLLSPYVYVITFVFRRGSHLLLYII